MTTRNFKIAKLPLPIREDLNVRLAKGEPVEPLVEWLNADASVRAILKSQFEGRLISEQHVSEWRTSGFLKWTTARQVVNDARAVWEGGSDLAASGISAEHLLLVITACYAALLQTWDAIGGSREAQIQFNQKLRALKGLTTAALALRRAEFQSARLQIARERLELQLEKQRSKSKSSAKSPAASSSESIPASRNASPVNPATAKEPKELPRSGAQCPNPFNSSTPPQPGSSKQPRKILSGSVGNSIEDLEPQIIRPMFDPAQLEPSNRFDPVGFGLIERPQSLIRL